MQIPNDYLERVYAGVLGKLVGVYLGRPFEGWTYQRIMKELGPIEYYVHERLNQPLVVTDDDVAGTFTFIRALEDYGISPDLTRRGHRQGLAQLHRRAALDPVVGRQRQFDRAHRLAEPQDAASRRRLRARSRPTAQTVAEQIGAQIFIDGWAMVAPRPAGARGEARRAGRQGQP